MFTNINKNNFKFININKYKIFFLLKNIKKNIYFILHSDIQFKKFYKIMKFIFGFYCIIKYIKFNMLKLNIIIFDKSKKNYVKVIKYINILNIISLFIKN
uniref:Uncharacterized protein n=1 Tax=Babesia duncani TaxID=323732 RepID=A0A385GNU1_9APIC|nr:hypothetical protein [Babesia duncani]